jgi:RHS repeat-associated protein
VAPSTWSARPARWPWPSYDDGRGNISTVTTSTGALACTVRYDPWGSPLSAQSPQNPCQSGSTINDHFYRGQRLDPITASYQLGDRTYTPGKASFLNPDTYRTAPPEQALSVQADPLTENRYAYVNGDPVNLSDPSGHAPVGACGAYSDCPPMIGGGGSQTVTPVPIWVILAPILGQPVPQAQSKPNPARPGDWWTPNRKDPCRVNFFNLPIGLEIPFCQRPPMNGAGPRQDPVSSCPQRPSPQPWPLPWTLLLPLGLSAQCQASAPPATAPPIDRPREKTPGLDSGLAKAVAVLAAAAAGAAAAVVAKSNNADNRGRIQAQGSGLEDSESWARPTPPTASEGAAMLDALWGRLTRRQQEIRSQAYQVLRKFILSRPPVGLPAGYSNRWANPGEDPKVARLDLEVLAGSAFLMP